MSERWFPRLKTDKEMGRPDRRERITMGLTYCENCQQLEGDTKTDEESGVRLCAECDEPVREVPEHDDDDMER